MIRRPWPEWWHWELDLVDHVFDRMMDRKFDEIDLRAMLERASSWRPNPKYPGRFLIETTHGGKPWLVSVEPNEDKQVLSVITAFRVE